MAKEADTGREMDELNMFKDTIENLENDIQMILKIKKLMLHSLKVVV